ncbi:hypothetical protein H2200_000426 [Cladophialophora chaetospira]|uniref:Uncharacterized protein n=1 Tax=Cladophialophora chaetospira TaxID=386627 RepID=A0AA39CQB6_9EURO|nr:hypothetical protein H2200_000426 [Cladophialophora chaetospira]
MSDLPTSPSPTPLEPAKGYHVFEIQASQQLSPFTNSLWGGVVAILSYLYFSEERRVRDKLWDLESQILELNHDVLMNETEQLKLENRRLNAMAECEELGEDASVEDFDKILDKYGVEVCCPCSRRSIAVMRLTDEQMHEYVKRRQQLQEE